jgi:tetratricopeptide (TPR) repeat protein
VSSALAAIVAKALALEPADRFRTAAELAQALEAVSLGEDWLGGWWSGRASRSWLRGGRWAVGALTLFLVVLSGVIWHRSGSATSRFKERDWILVADFDGPDDDPQLATAVRELTTAELNQSPFVSTLPRSQLNATMRLAGLADTSKVGPQLARELAYRSAVRAVLVGSITHLGMSNYSIVLHVVDADDGSDIVSVAGAAHDTLLIPTVQSLVGKVRSALGERRQSIEATLPLYQVATPSFAAYRRYIEGIRLQTRGDGRGSTRLLGEAIALDSGFASAWFTMAWNYLNDRMLDSARWAFEQAKRREMRLSQLQRYRLEADVAYTLDYDLPAAIRAYDLYLDQSPRSWAVQNNRGLYLLALGRYEDALESFDRAVAAHPFGPKRAQIQVMNKAATLITLGRLDEAIQTMRDLAGPFATYLRLMLDAATDRWREADSAATATASAPSSPGWLQVQATATAASSRAYRGAIRSADDVFARAARGATPDVKRWYHRARLLLALASGRAAPALPNDIAADDSPASQVTKAISASLVGDTSLARMLLVKIDSAPLGDRRRLGNGSLVADAWLDARAQHWRLAANEIAPAAAQGENDSALLDRVGTLTLRWLAADAYARAGQLDSAVVYLQLAVKPERMPGNEFALRGLIEPFAHRRLAQLNTALGRKADAIAHWRAFLAAFTDPDPDLSPLVIEAHDALARLGAA